MPQGSNQEHMTLGIIGVGDLAAFVIEGLRQAGDERTVLLSPRNREKSAELSARFDARVMPDNQAVADNADLVMVATRPPQILECVQSVRWRSGQIILSVAIDITRDQILTAAPGTEVVRAMPISSSAFGYGVTPVYPPNAAVEAVFQAAGTVHVVDNEAGFDAATVLAAYYLWNFELWDQVATRAARAGMPGTEANRMVASITRAAAEMAARHPEQRIRSPLETHGKPGSITRQGLDLLHDRKAFEPWIEAYDTVLKRLQGNT